MSTAVRRRSPGKEVATPSAMSGTASVDEESSCRWVDVCAVADLTPERGVAALVAGRQVALFLVPPLCAGARQPGGAAVVHAVGHRDPVSAANVMARGLVGSRRSVDAGTGEETHLDTVASPLHKQVYELSTGRCLDRDDLALPVWPTRVRAGRVEVAATARDLPPQPAGLPAAATLVP